MDTTELANSLVSGLSTGGTYAFLALAYSLIFSTTRVFNLAQAQLFVLGGLLGHTFLVEKGLPWYIAAVLVSVAVAVVGIVQERITIRPIKFGYNWILTTLGASFLLQALFGKLWGTEPLPVPSVISSQSKHLGLLRFVPSQLLVVGALLLLTLVIEIFAKKTRLGKAWRATSQNAETAAALGINTRLIMLGVFGAAAITAAIGGLMTSPTTYAAAYGGDLISFKSFLAVAIGGMTTTGGAVLGGLLLGLIEAISLNFVGAQFNLVVVFALTLAFLLVRPHGLVAGGAQREV